MAEEIVLRKSLMLAPICDGDQIAAAIRDHLYLYFQSPSPLALYVEALQERYSDVIPDDFFEYMVRAFETPFALDSTRYPDNWLTVTLAQLQLTLLEGVPRQRHPSGVPCSQRIS